MTTLPFSLLNLKSLQPSLTLLLRFLTPLIHPWAKPVGISFETYPEYDFSLPQLLPPWSVVSFSHTWVMQELPNQASLFPLTTPSDHSLHRQFLSWAVRAFKHGGHPLRALHGLHLHQTKILLMAQQCPTWSASPNAFTPFPPSIPLAHPSLPDWPLWQPMNIPATTFPWLVPGNHCILLPFFLRFCTERSPHQWGFCVFASLCLCLWSYRKAKNTCRIVMMGR